MTMPNPHQPASKPVGDASVTGSGLEPFETPVPWDEAGRKADEILAKTNLDQKLSYVSGHKTFFIKGFEEFGIPEIYMSDATVGVHIRRNLSGQLERSTAFPASLAFASSWNPELAAELARCVGEECIAGGTAILLGPGMNIYRHSQCGRNFEYFGEDPYLAASIIEQYVVGMSETGVLPTLKHFLANNTDYRRRTSNSVVDDRALHEIYLPAFQAGIDAGARCVMTSYNQVNGEYAGQSYDVITRLLRDEMGFDGLVMTDWNSVTNAAKVIQSGQDLEMPGEKWIKKDARRLLDEGVVKEEQVDRMCRSILQTTIAAGFCDRPLQDDACVEKIPAHRGVALQAAREGIVLLKNRELRLPLDPAGSGVILLTGTFTESNPAGGGSSTVEGYDAITMRRALEAIYGDRVVYRPFPTDTELEVADVVIQSVGTVDSEGWDRSFDLPAVEEAKVRRAVRLNRNTIVVVNSGSGINLSAWNDDAAAILYAWYPGDVGNQALAEIIAGKVNPSGKLPISIERRFEDSPGWGYIPEDETLYHGWGPDGNFDLPIYDIHYTEGVFVGYRWYDVKGYSPLYAFGHGLSYTRFVYGDLGVKVADGDEPAVEVTLTLKNAGQRAGAETVQLYVGDKEASVARPRKELKRFRKVSLEPGADETVTFSLRPRDLAFWDSATRSWRWEPGVFTVFIGGASDKLPLSSEFEIKYEDGAKRSDE